MTRGTIYAITNDIIIESVEFNGGMYPEEYGMEVIEMLEKCKTPVDFRIGVEDFNKTHHNYNEYLLFPHRPKDYMKGNVINMSKKYFELFFSDWTFWKNFSDKTVIFLTEEKKKITLEPNEQVAINFGKYEDHYKSLKECEELIER